VAADERASPLGTSHLLLAQGSWRLANGRPGVAMPDLTETVPVTGEDLVRVVMAWIETPEWNASAGADASFDTNPVAAQAETLVMRVLPERIGSSSRRKIRHRSVSAWARKPRLPITERGQARSP